MELSDRMFFDISHRYQTSIYPSQAYAIETDLLDRIFLVRFSQIVWRNILVSFIFYLKWLISYDYIYHFHEL